MTEQRPKAVFLISTKGTPKRHIRVSVYGFSKWHKYLIWKDPSVVFQEKPMHVMKLKSKRVVRFKSPETIKEPLQQLKPCEKFNGHKWIFRKKLKYLDLYRCSRCHAKGYYSPKKNYHLFKS